MAWSSWGVPNKSKSGPSRSHTVQSVKMSLRLSIPHAYDTRNWSFRSKKRRKPCTCLHTEIQQVESNLSDPGVILSGLHDFPRHFMPDPPNLIEEITISLQVNCVKLPCLFSVKFWSPVNQSWGGPARSIFSVRQRAKIAAGLKVVAMHSDSASPDVLRKLSVLCTGWWSLSPLESFICIYIYMHIHIYIYIVRFKTTPNVNSFSLSVQP